MKTFDWKTALFIAGIFILMIFSANAQSRNNQVTIDYDQLTSTQKANLEAQKAIDAANLEIADIKEKIETYGEWVGVGGEIGIAVKDGLSAVVDVADKFGTTKVGKFTMLMIAWKVMGKDIVGIIIGILFFFVFTIVLWKSMRKSLFPRKVLVEDLGWWKYPKKYEIVESKLDEDSYGWVVFLYIVAFIANIIIAGVIIF